MKQVLVYSLFTGPNSNTFAHQLLKNAGFDAEQPPGARGWDYEGRFRYGGQYFDKNGHPTAEWDELKEREEAEQRAADRRAAKSLRFVCFVAGTKVQIHGETKAIEDLREGELVLSWNLETGCIEPRPVTHLIRSQARHFVLIEGKAWSILCTTEHPFWSDGKWVPAKALVPGAFLLDIFGNRESIRAVTSMESHADIDVFNCTVADNHTYCVTNRGFVVHNK